MPRDQGFWKRVEHIVDTFPSDDAFLKAIEGDDLIKRIRRDELRKRISKYKRELEELERK